MAALHPREHRQKSFHLLHSRRNNRFSAVVAAVVATMVLIIMALVAPAVDATKALPDGHRCYLDKHQNYLKPYCAGSMWNCVVVATPNRVSQIYSGICNSSYTKGSYCMYLSVAYAVGTKNIYGNSLCKTCECNLVPKLASKDDTNKATCTCSPLPPCYVDYDGKPVGRFKCPSPQNMCLVTKSGGGGRDRRGLPVDKGRCPFLGLGASCKAMGKVWGPKFYAKGVAGVPLANDRCTRCTCGKNGVIRSTCKHAPGCTRK